jgi:hypothetical protein
MNSTLIKFIEDHIEWIDENKWIDFWEEATQRFLNNNTVAELVTILENAGIDTTLPRIELLDRYVTSTIMKVTKLPLIYTIFQVIDIIPLNRRFGFNLRQIESYIVNNKDKWDDVEIWYENHNWCIRRHKR